jgi:hypothetical protein
VDTLESLLPWDSLLHMIASRGQHAERHKKTIGLIKEQIIIMEARVEALGEALDRIENEEPPDEQPED